MVNGTVHAKFNDTIMVFKNMVSARLLAAQLNQCYLAENAFGSLKTPFFKK